MAGKFSAKVDFFRVLVSTLRRVEFVNVCIYLLASVRVFNKLHFLVQIKQIDGSPYTLAIRSTHNQKFEYKGIEIK